MGQRGRLRGSWAEGGRKEETISEKVVTVWIKTLVTWGRREGRNGVCVRVRVFVESRKTWNNRKSGKYERMRKNWCDKRFFYSLSVAST